MPQSIIYKRGESGPIEVKVKDSRGVSISLTGCTLFMGVKRYEFDDLFILTKQDGEFDKSRIDEGIFRVFLNSTELDLEPGIYPGGFRVSFPDGRISKELEFDLIIEPART